MFVPFNLLFYFFPFALYQPAQNYFVNSSFQMQPGFRAAMMKDFVLHVVFFFPLFLPLELILLAQKLISCNPHSVCGCGTWAAHALRLMALLLAILSLSTWAVWKGYTKWKALTMNYWWSRYHSSKEGIVLSCVVKCVWNVAFLLLRKCQKSVMVKQIKMAWME